MASIKASLSNSPQAGDDIFAWNEDSLLASGLYTYVDSIHRNVVTLNVTSNDLGGNAKSLFAIDDGNGHTNLADYDLSNADNNGAWENSSTSGDQIRIYNGNIQLDISGALAALGATDLNSLAAGDHIHDEFDYAIRLGNGTLSQARVTVDIQGQNDAGAIGGDHTATLTEDSTAPAIGSLTVVDPDHGESHTQAATNAVTDNGLGTYAVDADGRWTYEVNNALVQHLSPNETATDSFTVYSLDGTASQKVDITIQGQNDAPVVTSATQAGSVKEDETPTANGQVTATDVDDGDHQHYSGSAVGAFGTFAIDSTTGQWSYALNNSAANVQALAGGQTKDEVFAVTVTDDYGSTTTQDVTVHVSGTNDAPILQSLVGTGQELTQDSLTLSGAMAFTDVDLSDTHTVTVTPLGDGFIGSPSAVIGTESTNGGQGTVSLSYHLTKDQFDAAFPNGQLPDNYHQDYLVTIDDGHGGTSSQMVSVPLAQILADNGQSDQPPAITGGPDSGNVQEDQNLRATGQLFASDPDSNSVLTWNVVGGNPGHVTTYRVTMDEFSIQKNGSVIFDDPFTGTNPPTSPVANLPYLPTTQFTNADGRAVMDDAHANTAFSISDPSLDFTGQPTGFMGNFAIVATNADPTNTTLGLKSGTSFTISGVYDLVSSEADYGIRLSNGNGAIQFAGDDVVDLAVWQNPNGGLQVELNQINFVAGTMNLLAFAPITINPGDDQVLLSLSHSPPSSGPDTGQVTASFTVLHDGVTDYTVTLNGAGQIFQTGDWTRAGFEAVAPGDTSSFIEGTYGALAINQSGGWTYLLHNNQANVQALAEGQHVTDSFQVQVADQFGESDTRTINIDVAGTNDVPVLQSLVGTGQQLTDTSLSLTGAMAFTDVDLIDHHTVTITPQGNGYIGEVGDTVTEPFGGGQGAVNLSFNLTKDQLDAVFPSGQLPADYHQDYLVTIDDGHGGTSSQLVSIPLAQIIAGDTGGGGDNGGGNHSPFATQEAVSLPAIVENTSSPPGETIADLLNPIFSDADSGDGLAGFAIYGYLGSAQDPNPSAGTWEWFDGTNWTALPDVSEGHAVVVSAADAIRFVPAEGFTGEAPELAGRLIDSSVAVTSGDFVDVLNLTSSSPFSSNPVLVSETVIPESVPTVISNFVTLDYPGALNGISAANAINNAGIIGGYAETSDAGSIQSLDGWTYSNGTFSTVHIGNQNTVTAINNEGVLAGYESPFNSTPRYGFIQDGDAVTTINLDPSISTTVDGLNDAGNFVGSSFEHAGNFNSGFLSIDGNITFLNPFGSNDAHANGINNLDDVVGTYSVGGVVHAYIYDDGVFSTVDDPAAQQTIATDINNAGQIVGYYQDSDGDWHGYVDTAGIFTTVDNPLAVGTAGTEIEGINDAGQIVGAYFDAATHPQAFVADISNPVNQPTDDVLVAIPQGGTIFGGAGHDTFVFNSLPQQTSTIADFVPGDDVLQFSAAGFGDGLTTGASPTLLEGAPGSIADGGSNGYFIFDNTNPTGGTLYWDAGGSGTNAVALATLTGVHNLTTSDFHLV